MSEIEKLRKQLKEAEETEINNKLQNDLIIYKEKYEGKVHMDIHYTKSVQSVVFTYYKTFFIKKDYDEKKSIWYKGENLELYRLSFFVNFKLYKQEEKIAKSLEEIEYCSDGNLQIIPLKEYKFYRKACTNVISTLQDDILVNKPFDMRKGLSEYESDQILAVEKTIDIVDIKHIIVTDRESFLLGKSVFLNGNCYFLSPASIKFALEKLDEELKADNFSTSLLAEAGYSNRNSRAIDIVALQMKFIEIQKT